MTLSRFLVPLAALAALGTAACADRAPLSPTGPVEVSPPGTQGQRLSCTASVRARSVTCGGPSATDFRGAIIGGQGEFVRLTSTDVTFNEGAGTLSANVTVTNLLPYRLGTRNGTTADSGGVKVFFHTGPTVTSGTGTVAVANPDGVGAFTASGQPFFKYPGMLNPGATTAPRLWVFQVGPDVDTFSFTVLVYAEVQPSASRVIQPQPGDVVTADSLSVVVVANEPPGVSYVRASVGTRSTFLTYNGNRQWSGKLGLSGVTGRDQTLRVVTVAPADSLVQLVPFVYAQVPELTLSLPLEGTVARPTVRIAGSCADAEPCTITARIGGTTLFTRTATTAFDTTVSLAAFEGPATGLVLAVTATDPQNNSSVVRRTVFVESSPNLVEIGSAGIQVIDVDSTRLLFRDSTDAGLEVALLDVPSGVRTTIRAVRPGSIVTSGYLTPAGAIVAVLGPGAVIDSIFELRGGTASFVMAAARYRLRAAGEWAVWHSGVATLYRRNTTTGFQELVHANGQEGDVATNGDVAFTSKGQVYWYHAGGGTTQLLGAGSGPRTDGTQVLYYRGGNTSRVIYRHDGVSETAIGNMGDLDPVKPRFAVNGGWAVYVAVATNATRQLFSRAPDGTVRQVATNGAVQVDAVSATGDVVYTAGASRYFTSPPYSSATVVSHAWPNPVRFRGVTAFTAVGRTGFRIAP